MATPEYRPVDFDVLNEDWNNYRLPNGATVRVKIVVQQIFEQIGTRDEITGLPNYTVRSSNVISVVPPTVDE